MPPRCSGKQVGEGNASIGALFARNPVQFLTIQPIRGCEAPKVRDLNPLASPCRSFRRPRARGQGCCQVRCYLPAGHAQEGHPHILPRRQVRKSLDTTLSLPLPLLQPDAPGLPSSLQEEAPGPEKRLLRLPEEDGRCVTPPLATPRIPPHSLPPSDYRQSGFDAYFSGTTATFAVLQQGQLYIANCGTPPLAPLSPSEQGRPCFLRSLAVYHSLSHSPVDASLSPP